MTSAQDRHHPPDGPSTARRVHRRGARRPVHRDRVVAFDARRQHRRVRAQSRIRRVRIRCRVLRRDAREHRRRRSGPAGDPGRPRHTLGHDQRPHREHHDVGRRQRDVRRAPTRPARRHAQARVRSRRPPAFRDRSDRRRVGRPRRLRLDRGRRWNQFLSAATVRRRSRTHGRRGPREVHLVRHHISVRRTHLPAQAIRARELRGARLSDRLRTEHLHRRNRRTHLAPRGPGRVRRDESTGTVRRADSALPRDAVRRSDRRPQARRQQLAVGQLPHPPHAAVVHPRRKRHPRGPSRRRRTHRALLGRFGHQDGDGRRRGAGAGHRGAPRRYPGSVGPVRADPSSPGGEDPGFVDAEPVVVGPLRRVLPRLRTVAVRLPLLQSRHLRREDAVARSDVHRRNRTGVADEIRCRAAGYTTSSRCPYAWRSAAADDRLLEEPNRAH